MSASSSWVTCGTLSQDRCSAGPDSRWMRVSGCTSTGPNFEKSCAGTSGIPAPAGGDPPRTPPSAAGPRTPAITSSLVIRPFGPVPDSAVRSSPSSRASRRTPGLACTPSKSASASAPAPAPAAALAPAAAPTSPAPAVAPGTGASAIDRAAGSRAAASGSAASSVGGSCWSVSGGGSTAAPSVSSDRIGDPRLTRSPTLTRSSRTVPAAGEGMSMVALSDSRVTSGSSLLTTSPGATWISMTGTSAKSPRSGTLTSVMAAPSGPRRIGCVRVDAVPGDRVGRPVGGYRPVFGQRRQRGQGHVVPVDLEEAAQVAPVVRTAVAIRSQHPVPARHEGTDLVGERPDVVGRRDHRAGRPRRQAFLHVGTPRLRARVQHVPPLGGQPVPAQLGEAGRAPYVGRHAVVRGQQVRPGQHLPQDRPAAEQLHPRPITLGGTQQVHAG